MTAKQNETVTITVWKSGFSVPHIVGGKYSENRVSYRGEVVTLTPEMVDETRDVTGATWLDLSEEQQEERWGEVRFRRGDHSGEVLFVGDDDSTVIYRRREYAELAARKISDPAERAKAFEEITRLYGSGDSGQRTLRSY